MTVSLADQQPESAAAESTGSPTPRWLAWALVAVYIIVYSVASILQHEAFRTNVWDLGLFEQIMWNLSHGYGFQSSVIGFNFLGDHLAFSLVLLAPLYWLVPHAWTLLIIQSVIIGAGGIAAFRFAERHLPNPYLAVCATTVYLTLPILGYANLFDFHVEPLAATALMFALNLMEEERWRWVIVLLVIALLTKEEIPLVIAVFGVYVILRGQHAMGIGITVVSIAYFIVGAKWLSPLFGGYDASFSGYMQRYAHLGGNLFEVARTVVLHPGYALVESFTKQKLETLQVLWSSTAYVSILGVAYLPLALPILLINYLSGNGLQFNLEFQYLSLAAPGLYAAMVYGLAQILKVMPKRVPALIPTVILGILLVGTSVRSSWLQWGDLLRGSSFVPHPHAQAFREAIALIPKGVSVGATNYAGAHTAARHDLYLSVPFIYDTGSSLPSYPLADCMLIEQGDVFASPENIEARLAELASLPEYRLLYQNDGVFLYCKNHTGS